MKITFITFPPALHAQIYMCNRNSITHFISEKLALVVVEEWTIFLNCMLLQEILHSKLSHNYLNESLMLVR